MRGSTVLHRLLQDNGPFHRGAGPFRACLWLLVGLSAGGCAAGFQQRAPDPMLLGAQSAEQGEIDESIAAYKEAVELNPSDIRAQNELGRAYMVAGDHETAITVFRTALSLDRRLPQVHFNLGLAYAKLGRYQDAIAELTESAALSPTSVEARVQLGFSYLADNQPDRAIAAFDDALTLDASEMSALYGGVLATARKGRYPEVFSRLQALIAAHPESGGLHLAYGRYLGHVGRYDEASQAYKRAVTLGAKENPGVTPLHLVAEEGDAGLAAFLLDHGAEIDAKNPEGWTPLLVATRTGHIALVELLLNRGAAVNAATTQGTTPLHLAAGLESPEILILLMIHGAKIRATTVDGWMPLHVAAANGRARALEVLLGRRNLEVDEKLEDGITALHLAARNDHLDATNVLLAHGAHVEGPQDSGWTPLHFAARHGGLPVVTLLLNHHATLTARTKHQFTALHLAAISGNVDVVDLLLKRGAELEVRNHDGQTPLHLAARFGLPDTIRPLLEAGADREARTTDGWHPLHQAVRDGTQAAVALLIDQGADVQARTMNGWSALHLAAWRGHTAVVGLLLDRGADPQAITRPARCQTPLHIAQERGYHAVSALLAERGGATSQEDRSRCRPVYHQPIPEPQDAERAGVGISLAIRSGLWPLQRVVAPDQVYFVRLDSPDPSDPQNPVLPANVVQGNRAYLLNIQPGRYAVVAIREAIGTTSVPVFLPADAIRGTAVLVTKGTVSFMGDYVVNIALGLRDGDPEQAHFVERIGYSASPPKTGTLHFAHRDAHAEDAFFASAEGDLHPSAWSRRFRKGSR